VLSTVILGLVPATYTGKLDLSDALKAETGGVIGRRRAMWQSSLVVIQVSLSFVLLVGGGLLLRNLRSIENTSPGFLTTGVYASGIDLVGAGYDAQRTKNFQDDLIARVQSLPGVESAAFTRVIPFGYRSYSEGKIGVVGYETRPDEQTTVEFSEVGPSYLATMGIPLLSGREFTRRDDETAPPAAVVNEVMAAKFWAGRDPVGEHFQVNGRTMQVVGLARTSKYRNLAEPPTPFFYVAMRQNALGRGLVIRTSMPLSALTPALAREVHAIDANLAPFEVISMQEQVDLTMAAQRMAVRMLMAFGTVALLLAAIGVYGVMSYTVSQSTRELGLRMALGASTLNVLRMVMMRGLTLMVGGLVLGTVVALTLGKMFGLVIYKVSPRDPAAYGAALAMMLFASIAACLLPARRAIRTDPSRALRQ
jgi:predicted permease